MKKYAILLLMFIIVSAKVAMAERLTVIAPVANIRSAPTTNSDVLWKVEKYHPIFVIHKSGAWYQFRDFENDRGWVHKSLIGKVPSVITKKDLCNIRSGPGTKEEIVLKVEKGIPFKVVKREGNWILVEHADGDTGWIHDSLVW